MELNNRSRSGDGTSGSRLQFFTVLDDSNAGPEDGYCAGQVVYVDPDIKPAVGCGAVATLPGGHRLGRLQEDADGRYLLLLNPALAERVVRLPAGVAYRGKVVGVLTRRGLDEEPQPRRWMPVVGITVPSGDGIEASQLVQLPAAGTREEAQAVVQEALRTMPDAVCCTVEQVQAGQVEPLAEAVTGTRS